MQRVHKTSVILVSAALFSFATVTAWSAPMGLHSSNFTAQPDYAGLIINVSCKQKKLGCDGPPPAPQPPTGGPRPGRGIGFS